MSRESRIFEAEDEASGESERYLCLVEIGRGGMAVVYRAWDSHMNRDVALKVAREDVAADPEVRRRFEEESRIAGTFSHPSILPVFDRGTYAGRPYLAMQLIDGMPLDRSNLPLAEAIERLATAAEAVDHAHERGVIHRDLKPSNILLARDGRVYLTDFGVARQTTAEDRRTVAGTVVGTPAYMSPEQARGEDVDARADVYALGATLYELAVGRPPYEGTDPQAVLEAVRTRPPQAPRKANPKVSRNVEAIIRMAMERLPGDRYATARALAEDLRLYQNRRRPLARARGLRYYIGRELVRHPIRTAARTLMALILSGALILGSLVGGGWLDYRRALAEANLERKLALLEEASTYYTPARRTLKELRASIAEAERALLARIRGLERETDEAIQGEDFDAADRLLPELTALDRASGDDRQARRDRRKAEADSRELLDRIRTSLAGGQLDAAETDWKKLPPAHPERDGLRERIREGRFAEGRLKLEKVAVEGDAAAFEPLFATLASPAHAVQKNRDADLGKAARTLGLALAEKGNHAGTIRWLTEAEKRGAANADLYRVRGLALVVERNWDAAERDLKSFRQHSPGTTVPSAYWKLFHQRAKEDVAAGRWDPAQSRLTSALELSEEAILWHDMGLVRWKTVFKADLSLGDLEKALSKDPDLKPSAEYAPIVLAHVRSGNATALGLETAAERDFLWTGLLARLDQVAGRREERTEELRVVRATLLRKLRRVEDALAELAPAGDSARVRLARARAHASAAARPEAADGALTRAYEQVAGAPLGSPDDPAVLAWKALLGARLKRDQAAADFQAAQARGGLFAAARLEHARLLQGAAALKELELALEGVDRLGEDDLLWLGAEPLAKPLSLARTELRRAGLLLRAQTRLAAQDMRGCVDDATLLLDDAAPPPDPAAAAEARRLRGLARLQLPKSEWKGAAEDLEAYLQVQPDDARTRLMLANAYLRLERAEEAEKQCDVVLQKWPNAPEVFYLRGRARRARGHENGARSDFQAALNACPKESPLFRLIERELPPR